MPKHSEPFAKTGDDDQPTRRGRKRVTRLKITDCGVDWEGVDDDTKASIIANLAADDDTATAIHSFKSSEHSDDPVVEPKHIEWFLTFIEKAEQWLIPKLVERKTRQENGTYFKIDKDVAANAFRFTSPQRGELVPLGVETANRHLPDKVKKALAMVGPGTEFAGKLLMALQEQQVRAITMQLNKNARASGSQTSVHPTQEEALKAARKMQPRKNTSAPEQAKPNGKEASPVEPPIVGSVKEQTA